MAAKDDLGRAGEHRAAEYLLGLGYEILARNWRCTAGEIDIVARCGAELAIVEVKTRRGLGFGHPFEAVDARKRARLWRLAATWSREHRDIVAGTEVVLHAIAIIGPDPATAALEHLRDVR